MDFVSADRSGEAEFNSQLQNYNINVEAPERPNFFYWLFRAKKMKGVDYIFKTSKHTGEMF